ncbi:MAG: [Bacteroidaceae bacterium]|nr:[FeFe] hydrogenase H-cluster maturation GTPase HydF [Bacteroidaceae bacterium]
MQQIPRSNRIHIAIFGRRNVGKSSLVNALSGQAVSIVSDIAGTTTDVVWKNMELPGIGAVVIGDTAGYDDIGELGVMRVESTKKVLPRIDLALLVLHNNPDDSEHEKQWLAMFEKGGVPVVTLLGHSDVYNTAQVWKNTLNREVIPFSAVTGDGKEALLKAISTALQESADNDDVTDGLVTAGDVVVLVMPQDAQAPKGRLIQPQVQTLRNLLDKHAIPLCCAPDELPALLDSLKTAPSLVITDSQVFAQVEKLKPESTRLTSFSVLMARQKGDIEVFRKGAEVLKNLPYNARVLIAEACSHIPQNEDIGRVKLPRMLRGKFGEELSITVVSGNDFPLDLSGYDLVIHCGACMFTKRHVMARVRQAVAQNVPITNYGIAIASLTGILDKVVY